MPETGNSRPARTGKWITAAIWLAGLILVFTRPLQVGVFHLDTGLYMASTFGPNWALLLVLMLAGILAIFVKAAQEWPGPLRIGFCLGLLVLLAVPQIDMIMMFLESYRVRFPPTYIDPIRAVLLWVTPLFLYGLPALPVALAWLDKKRRSSLVRALGIAVILWCLVYIPYGLLVNDLITHFTQP